MTKEKTMVASKPDSIRGLIASDMYKRQFAMALPKHLKPERFIRIALTALTRTPKLMQCTQASLISCLLDLSQLGLEPDGRKAHLIPYGEKCTLIIDYKGLVDLARRSGEISDIHADVVCENDKFDYSFGTDAKLLHKPALSNKGKVIAAYSFVKLKDGSASYEVMSIDEIAAIRKRSKASGNGPWVTDWNEMAKKTVFRRHAKWLPLSSEFQEAVDKDYDVPIDIAAPKLAGKPEVEMPQAVAPPEDNAYKTMLDSFATAKAALGEKAYYKILNKHGFEKSNQIRTLDLGEKILGEMVSTNIGE